MAKPAVLTMISGASAPTVSNTFVNNNSEICTLQISGTFASATVKVEGIVDINSGRWVSLATFDLTDLDLKTNGMSDKSLYQVGIAGILRVRISLTAINGGDITVMANFVGTSFSGEELPPSSEVPFTAYDLAVLGGYTGTQADYEAALANVINVGPLAEQAATSASDAQTSANTAAASASSARTYANNAASSASGAQTSATNAASSANSAMSSAATAQTAATNAGNSASTAQSAAASAGTSASGAQTAAGNAASSASNALTSAGTAAISASNAASSANNAANSATSAATSATQAANAVGAIAPALVTSWLNDNVNPAGSAVVVDSSLSISGAAADAKVTGDKITNITDAFNTTLKISDTPVTLTKGKYIDIGTGKSTPSSGTTDTSKKYARTNLLSGFRYRLAVNLNNADYEYRVMYYTQNGSLTGSDTSGYLGYTEYVSGLQYIPRTALNFALSIRRVDQAEMTDAYVAEISAALIIYTATDITLNERGMAADGRWTGIYIGDANGAAGRYLSEIDNVEFEPGSDFFESGDINSSGSSIQDTSKIRSFYLFNKYAYFRVPFDAKFTFYWYNSASASGLQATSDERTVRADKYAAIPLNENQYCRIVLSKIDKSAFTEEEIAAVNASFKLYTHDENDITENKSYESFKLLYNKALLAGSADQRYEIIKGSKGGNSGVTSDAKFARTYLASVINKTYRIACPEGFIPYFTYYTSSGSANSSTYIANERPRLIQSDYIFMPPATAQGLIVTFYATDHRDITDADVATIRAGYMIYTTSVPTETIQAGKTSSTTAFIAYMNQMCTKLGMGDSSFVDSSGLSRSNATSPEDELKLALAVGGNYKATDIWSTKDRSFTVGGDHARTLAVTNNVYGAESAGSAYKLLGGKGGSLTSSSSDTHRKARVALYEVAGNPVAVSLMGPDEWIYNNIVPCAQDLCAMMYAKLNNLSVAWMSSGGVNFRAEPSTQSTILSVLSAGTLLIVYNEADGWTHCRVGTQDGYVTSQYVTTTMGGNLKHLLDDGGGYAAVRVPVCVGAYQNAYTPAEILARDDALSANADAAQTPASTTKTLTMLCALNLCPDLQETIDLVSSDISSGSGSTFYAGDKLILEDALRIMMMESSNTLATAIGRWVGRKLLANQYQRDGIYPSV